MPYKYFISMYTTSDLLSDGDPLDEEILNKKFARIYNKIQEIHFKLYEGMLHNRWIHEKREVLSQIYYCTSHGLSPENIIGMLKTFEIYGLRQSAEAVVDCLWKISYPMLPLIYPEYSSLEANLLRDWRKVIGMFPSVADWRKTAVQLALRLADKP